jgi:DhnA family fructose-bisphosphate aldolase class Ia
MGKEIAELRGKEGEDLLNHTCTTAPKERLHLPCEDFVDRVIAGSDRNDLAQALRTAVINKRAGGMGLMTGRKAFQKPMEEGIQLLHAVQNVYLDERVTVA